MGELTQNAEDRRPRGVAAVAMMVATLLVSGGLAAAAVPPVIDPGQPVTAGSCIACHDEIAAVSNERVRFDHAQHAQTRCSVCHTTFAHGRDGTTRPIMETCFTCHGVPHGPQRVFASGECAACHPASFELRPESHVKTWKGKPHAAPAKADPNACMLCHEAKKDCDSCHRDEKVDVGPMPGAYLSVLVSQPATPSAIVIEPFGPTSIAQCSLCHPDIDDFAPGRLTFSHEGHLEQNIQCSVCHPLFAHSPGKTYRSDMRSCYRCHGLDHPGQGEVATSECSDCHPKGFELKPKDHTAAFEASKHKDPADRDPAYCALCHEPAVCVECHDGRKTLPGGRRSKKAIPAGHRTPRWQGEHGVLYLRAEGQCAICHDGKSCTRCHQTVVPHATDWVSTHAAAVRGTSKTSTRTAGTDCNVCHSDRRECQSCHHGELARSELVPENCVRCHPEMKTQPPTKIRDKGLSEHAVHFGVEESKGRPYVCDDCHVDFGTTRLPGAEGPGVARSSHDLRLCYGCHGALDFQNREIAPYTGVELCRRCHADLRL